MRALYSAPTYDPNAFVGGISSKLWRALNEDEARPLLNRAIQTRYPPASPFKLAIGAMALKRGLIGLDTHMPTPCRGGMRLGNRVFRCWKKEGHGSLDLVGAVAASCDVYFYQVGLRLGLNAIIEDGVLMGFRDKSGIDLENEKDPIYPASTAYFDRLYGPRNWSPPATVLNFSIGQGENTQTLINMMKFYDGLASDGRASTPYVVRQASTEKRDLGLTAGPARRSPPCRSSRSSSGARPRERGGRTSPSRGRPVPRRTRTARTTAGSSGSPRPMRPSSSSAAIMEFGEHGTTVAPYVVKALEPLPARSGHRGHDQGQSPGGRDGGAAGHRAATDRARSRLRRARPARTGRLTQNGGDPMPMRTPRHRPPTPAGEHRRSSPSAC